MDSESVKGNNKSSYIEPNSRAQRAKLHHHCLLISWYDGSAERRTDAWIKRDEWAEAERQRKLIMPGRSWISSNVGNHHDTCKAIPKMLFREDGRTGADIYPHGVAA